MKSEASIAGPATMRIRVLSDLHLEFGGRDLANVPADVVVLAGDIDRAARGVLWARKRLPDVPVLYVAGNHEHYDERIGRLHEKLREAAAGSNVTILENETLVVRGVRFFGATLWTDFELFADRHAAMAAAGSKTTGMNDYRKIRRADTSRLKPVHTAMLHAQSRLELLKFLGNGDRSRSVVITHHAPSAKSLPESKRSDVLSAAYASHLDELIVQHGPVLWIHGHIHESRDYMIGKTRVLNNPGGYEFQAGDFRPELVVEV